ncbi:hypothetical protein ACFC0S_36160 [Streptomyces sp. NPDC056084]|uniref:hypothetical protein n=1 Tax=unclassified Streptomyces TaxID=2593676 RepID=UPI0035DCB06F
MLERDELDIEASRLRDRLNTYTMRSSHLAEAPKRVHEAWTKVRELADAASDSLDAWEMLDHQGKRMNSARQAEHRAYLEGKGPKPRGTYKPMDVAARRADALLECAARVELALGASSFYDQLLAERDVTEETRTVLLSKFDGLQDRTLEAINAAQRAFSNWLYVRDNLSQLTADLGLGGGPTGSLPTMGNELHRWFSEAQDAWPALERLLGSNHPVGSGRWAAMSHDELKAKPPVWARELLMLNHPWSDERKQVRRVEMKERAEGRVVSALEVPADMSPAEARELLPSTR